MTLSFINVGCRLNYAEIDYLAGFFAKRGEEVDFSRNGDIILINTCAVTKEAERKSFSLIRRYARIKSVVVTGCLVALAREKIEKIPGVEKVFDLKEKERMIEDAFPLPSRNRAFLKIVDGCPGLCSFCIVPEIRGREIRSKPEELIRKEISFLSEKGFFEIVLTGLNLGLYGQEKGTNLASLLWRIFENSPGNFRIRLSSLEPDLIDESLLSAIANLPVCRHLHIPIQSFDQEILLKMGRRYSPEMIKEKIAMILSFLPEVNIGCDIIVGFSGETEAAFSQTEKALEELPFGYFHIFPFSPRPKTRAFSFPDDVSPQEKKRRVRILRELGRKKRLEYQKRFLGKKLFAVQEREGMGVTDNYLRVKILNSPTPKGIFPVQIEKVVEEFVIGKIIF
uniref:MiaB/RimO family radical SAM methylthiotransferase n=1 Tax=candidate division WOR-3 bacterium TaxID=2052148 RepID=A0A7C3UR15_UNCW3